MMEMRWLVWEEEETVVPPVSAIQYGKPFERTKVTKRKLQYRQQYDSTVYAQDPGGFIFPMQRNMQWSNWKDVPEVKE